MASLFKEPGCQHTDRNMPATIRPVSLEPEAAGVDEHQLPRLAARRQHARQVARARSKLQVGAPAGLRQQPPPLHVAHDGRLRRRSTGDLTHQSDDLQACGTTKTACQAHLLPCVLHGEGAIPVGLLHRRARRRELLRRGRRRAHLQHDKHQCANEAHPLRSDRIGDRSGASATGDLRASTWHTRCFKHALVTVPTLHKRLPPTLLCTASTRATSSSSAGRPIARACAARCTPKDSAASAPGSRTPALGGPPLQPGVRCRGVHGHQRQHCGHYFSHASGHARQETKEKR